MVDSGASMHMLSRKDLNLEEQKTVSRNPTTADTANGEVQTNEEATVHVHDLGLFVTVQVLEDRPAVRSHGKLCDYHGYSYEWSSGQKPHLVLCGRKYHATQKIRAHRFSGVIKRTSQLDYEYILNIGPAGLNNR